MYPYHNYHDYDYYYRRHRYPHYWRDSNYWDDWYLRTDPEWYSRYRYY